MPAQNEQNSWLVIGLVDQVKRQKLLFGVASVIALICVTTLDVTVFWVLAGWTAVCLAALVSDAGKNSLQPSDAASPSRPTDAGSLEINALVSCLPYPCFLLHGDGRVIFQNQPARDAVGVIEAGTILFSLLRAPEIRDAFERLVERRAPVQFEFVRRRQSEQRFEGHAALVRGASRVNDGADDQIVLSLRDLTQQQKLDQMRADFVANASHELRTPLASLIGFIETLQGPARNDAKAREEFLAIMGSQAQRMSRLIDDLLSLNRIEMNVHVRPQQKLNFVDVVGHVIDTLKPIAIEAGVKIDLVFDAHSSGQGNAYQVMGERDELVQVVQNLVENAIKYGQEGKRVDISLHRDVHSEKPNLLHLKVCDFGPGIAPEHLPRLTERFYRVDVVSSREKGGTGLGLAIVKHILNRHRGRLQIQSEPGRGACFNVTIEEAGE